MYTHQFCSKCTLTIVFRNYLECTVVNEEDDHYSLVSSHSLALYHSNPYNAVSFLFYNHAADFCGNSPIGGGKRESNTEN